MEPATALAEQVAHGRWDSMLGEHGMDPALQAGSDPPRTGTPRVEAVELTADRAH